VLGKNVKSIGALVKVNKESMVMHYMNMVLMILVGIGRKLQNQAREAR